MNDRDGLGQRRSSQLDSLGKIFVGEFFLTARDLILNDVGLDRANKNRCLLVGLVDADGDSLGLMNAHLIGDGLGQVRIKNVKAVAGVDEGIPHVEFRRAVDDGFELALLVPADVTAERSF